MDQNFDIVKKVADILKLREKTEAITALFLGAKAGAFFRSLQYSTLGSFGLRTDFSSLTPLERCHECYRILCDPLFTLQDVDFVLTEKDLLKEIRAAVPELCIAELTKRGIFNPILSVSIYKEFEEAFQQMEMRELQEFVVVWPKKGGDMSRSLTGGRDAYALIKVFGDIAAREYNVNQRFRYLEENKALTKIITDLRNTDILIVGADQIWDQHVFRYLFPHSIGGVWYVNDEAPAKDSALSEYLKDCQAELILGPDGQYENFFRSLSWHITGTVP